jgi:NADPH:quinone reductase-like Zn-dependent oxidoreductase
MRAIVVPEAGGTDKLTYADIDKPVVKAGEILVKVKAVGINPMDALIRGNAQMLTAFLGEERPAILGWDVAGEVAEIGAQVTGFEMGEPVFALLPQGRGYAAYVAVRADLTVRKPANISYEEAAAVPIAGIVAWEALVEIGKVKKGDHVLIHAGAGGVGHFAVQLAKHLGATVTATASAKNRDFVLSLGADQVIDYTSQQFEEVLTALDFVLDTIGGETLERSIGLVKKGGSIVTIIPPVAENVQEKARASGINLTLLIGQGSQQGMQALATLLSTGALKAHVSAVYPFSEMAHAHTAIESRRTVGKIVVKL